MKNCKKCGRALLENEKKCPYCAKKGAETVGRVVQVGGGLLVTALVGFIAKNKGAIFDAGRNLVSKNKEKVLKTCGDLVDKNKDRVLKAGVDGATRIIKSVINKK